MRFIGGLRSPVFQDVARCLVLAVVATMFGLAINRFREKPLPLIYQSKETRIAQTVARIGIVKSVLPPDLSKEPGGGILSLDEFRSFVEGKKGMVLDARPEIFHRFGHVPGAISFPREDFASAYAKWKLKLESDKNQPLAVYCSDFGCLDSDLVRKGLISLGYTRVCLFKGGWDEWTRAHLPEEKQ